jgi:glycosyltransferase involved in cell wall biosynthesis
VSTTADDIKQGVVSVIIPAYNRRDLLGETLESVKSQTYPHVELLIVDDGSSDGTSEYAEAWLTSEGNPDWSLLRLEANVGKSAAVNRAMKHARGEFMMILDSDDVLLPGCLEQEVAFLRRHESSGMVSSRAFVLRDGVRTAETIGAFQGKGAIADVASYHGDLLFNGNVVISSSALIRSEVARKVGDLDTRLRVTHDWDYWIRMSKIAAIGFLEGPFLWYRVSSGGALSTNRSRLLEEAFMLLEAGKGAVEGSTYRRALARELKEGLRLAFYAGEPWQCLMIAWFAIRSIAPGYIGSFVR